MIIHAVDPGLTSGFARVIVDGRSKRTPVAIDAIGSFENEQELIRVAFGGPCDFFIVEDFIGAGPRSAEAIHTLKLVGYFQYRVDNDTEGTTLVTQVPQRRKAFVTTAEKMMREQGYEADRHATDALAHILSFMSRNE